MDEKMEKEEKLQIAEKRNGNSKQRRQIKEKLGFLELFSVVRCVHRHLLSKART